MWKFAKEPKRISRNYKFNKWNFKSKLDTTVEINSNPEDKSKDIIQNYVLNKKHGIGNMIEQLRDMENRLISKSSCWFDLSGVSFLNFLSTLYSSKAGPFSATSLHS